MQAKITLNNMQSFFVDEIKKYPNQSYLIRYINKTKEHMQIMSVTLYDENSQFSKRSYTFKKPYTLNPEDLLIFEIN